MAEQLAINGGQKAITLDFPKWPVIDEETIKEVNRVLREESLSQLGKEGIVGQFEDNFAAYQGRKYGLAVNGGTAALDIGVAIAGVEPGAEVITSPYTWGATVGCILHNNAIPVFADIDARTYTLDPQSVRKKITPHTKAIVVVHIYGHPTDTDPIMEMAEQHGLKVVEDCAQAHGATYKGRKVGSLGHIGAFSLQASKNLTGGEGGVLVFDDPEMYEHALSVATHPARQNQEVESEYWKQYIDSLQVNYRMHPLAAAIANVGLRHLDEQIALRQRNAAYLFEGLADVPGVRPTYVAEGCIHAFHMIPLDFVPEELPGVDRETFIKALSAEGVPIGHYVSVPIHLRGRHRDIYYYGKECPWSCHLAGRKITYAKGDCPVAEERCEKYELNLPGSPFGTECQPYLDQLIEAFRKVTGNIRELAAVRV